MTAAKASGSASRPVTHSSSAPAAAQNASGRRNGRNRTPAVVSAATDQISSGLWLDIGMGLKVG
ncbi:hypothetical protein D3C87_2152110 [compost metagenome]